MSAVLNLRESYTDEERAAVETQLERLLANPFFSNSRRFPSFLRYVVRETLSGHTERLKERTLGVQIFGKDAQYDTANDPIVRVTAGEIRKRIAQYYQDPRHQGELRLSLPPGSYIPQFDFHPVPVAAPMSAAPAALFEPALPLIAPEPAGAPVTPLAVTPQLSGSPASPNVSGRARLSFWLIPAMLLLLLIAAGLGAFVASHRLGPIAQTDFWKPILGSDAPILFSVADQPQYTAISLRDADDPERQVSLNDKVTAIVIDDLSTITKIAGVVQSADRHYTLRGEDKTTLMDLRAGPSVIVGAFDNAWTLRLLRPLRFHFANNPEMTSFSILDTARSTAAGSTKWAVDRTQQIATNNYRDYAIVARFTDATTGQPTLIAAGIGRGGTIAAGEFLTSPDLLRSVEGKRPANGSQNVEVVLSTQIIDGEPGTPTVEAVYYW